MVRGMGEHDGGRLEGFEGRGATAHQPGRDLARNVAHVVGPCGQVLVFHRRVLRGVLLTDGKHRRLGTLQVPYTLLDC